jgi:hydroxypyruvate isomerase
MLFTEAPFLPRFKAAADSGFSAVEFMFPYEFSPRDIAAALKDNGLELVLHNLPVGDWARGDRGTACQLDRVGEFRDGVSRAIDYGQALACPKLNCLAGILPNEVPAESGCAVLGENLQYTTEKLAAAKIGLLLEPVNKPRRSRILCRSSEPGPLDPRCGGSKEPQTAVRRMHHRIDVI